MCRTGISYIERDIGFCRWRQQVIRRRGGGFITKTVFEEVCVSVRWHIERRKRLAKGECSFLSERRQAAELARTSISHTPYMCGNGNENTSRVYGRFAR